MIALSAKPLIEQIQKDLKGGVAEFYKKFGRKPKLSVVLVGEDPASVIYTTKKGEACVAVGMEHATIRFPATATPQEVRAHVETLNLDSGVDGILIQRPLPKGFKEEDVLYWVTPEKDVDAFHPENTGRLSLGLPCFAPCTPSGVMELLKHYQIPIAGRVACVVGRSSIVGKPMAALLLQADATVIQAHSKTKDLAAFTRQAEILIVAAGKPGLIGAEHVRDGAVVVDVGIHRDAQGKVIGDVRFEEVSKKCSAITPVPGGVGPMTIQILLKNTLFAAKRRETV